MMNVFEKVDGSRSVWREPMHEKGEDASFTQKASHCFIPVVEYFTLQTCSSSGNNGLQFVWKWPYNPFQTDVQQQLSL